jgi:hypothetical protein
MDETPPAVGTAGPDAPQRAGLRANAIDLEDAVIVGMASSGPTASAGLRERLDRAGAGYVISG